MATERSETPAPTAQKAPRTRWAQLTLDPLASGIPRAAAVGLTLWGRLDVGASFDWRYHAPGAVIGVRW